VQRQRKIEHGLGLKTAAAVSALELQNGDGVMVANNDGVMAGQ
jgi:hypothetical protein